MAVTYNSQTVVVDLPHTKYIDKILRSNSYEELMWLFKQAESPTKEISESYAAFHNIKKFTIINNHHWLHIGDGTYARTAALFSMLTKSINTSIDPNLNLIALEEWITKFKIDRLNLVKSEYEDFRKNLEKNYSIVCVHAHVDLIEVDKKFPNWSLLYTNPCCHPAQQTFNEKYMRENNITIILNKIDLGIVSEKRNVILYKKLK